MSRLSWVYPRRLVPAFAHVPAALVPKARLLRTLIGRLNLQKRGWMVVHYWDVDRRAIGIAVRGAPRRLVYVSNQHRTFDGWYYASEEPTGPALGDFEHVHERDGVSVEDVIAAVELHLSG